MNEQWGVVVEPYVIDDLMAFGIRPLDVVTPVERVGALADEFTASDGAFAGCVSGARGTGTPAAVTPATRRVRRGTPGSSRTR